LGILHRRQSPRKSQQKSRTKKVEMKVMMKVVMVSMTTLALCKNLQLFNENKTTIKHGP
jgi:hypothetical protein